MAKTFGKIENGMVVYPPVNQRLENGEMVMNYDTREDLLIADGWREVRINGMQYSNDDDSAPVIEDMGDWIQVTYPESDTSDYERLQEEEERKLREEEEQRLMEEEEERRRIAEESSVFDVPENYDEE